MEEKNYTRLVRLAIVLTLAWIGWTLFDTKSSESAPGSYEVAAAEKYLEDGNFLEALVAFETAHKLTPSNIGALRGKAQTLMRMGISNNREAMILSRSDRQLEAEIKRDQANLHLQQSFDIYSAAIQQEVKLGISESNRIAVAVSYANRGILRDQMGHHEEALGDYEKAMEIDTSVADGPGLLTRFMRNQTERPPNIADRARYLKQQMALPESDRILRIPGVDAEQHAYKMD